MTVFSFKFILLVVCALFGASMVFDINRRAIPVVSVRYGRALSSQQPLEGTGTSDQSVGADAAQIGSIQAEPESTGQVSPAKKAKIGKVTMLYGEPNPLYERALRGQEVHNEKFGYPMFTLREKTLPGYWSKPSYILSLILNELAKPEAERLEWLFWVDGDIVVMNPNVPLEVFLPPEPTFSDINCIVTNDHRGLNNGAFFIRVDEWSVWLLSAIVSLTTYQPDVKLRFGDQTAMQIILAQERFAKNTVYVPQRWFNAYAGYRGVGNHDPFAKPRRLAPNSVIEGDLQVHLAGGKKHREEYMTPFLDASEMHTDKWEIPYESTKYEHEIAKFWNNEAPHQLKEAVASKEAEPVQGIAGIGSYAIDPERTRPITRRKTRRSV